ncbi:hypothetical protein JR316_0013179 [Psilocybe cubensis]|uniref:2OGFeDO JBP1/TET oxygenase domain-containing protein n=2 Tax=Psilocybe cubensis TaxID=181762 RepID=A0A8H7XUA9_PSICU|nr:hypothetical protein JR316_0013179 [Psilocybe cubensis]KAH9474714.1 hypothetical protein JR316_0013179 [Psilocybe cubensis]
MPPTYGPFSRSPAMIKTMQIAHYLCVRFARGIGNSTQVDSDDWTLTETQEFNQLADVLARAFKNKKMLSWKADDYKDWLEVNGKGARGTNAEFERRVAEEFPPLVPGVIVFETEPFILCDIKGNILMWYLPGALKNRRQLKMWKELKILQGSFSIDEYSSSWRKNTSNYMKREDCKTLAPGTVSMAPAWFQQGHAKSNPLEVSAELRKARGLRWIENFSDSAALIGAALSIMHTWQWQLAIQAMDNLYRDPDLVAKNETLPRVLNAWTSPLTGISVINNRLETPTHRDRGSAYEWFDILSSIGKYQNGYMRLPGAGVEVAYGPGTLVGIAGKILTHNASSVGERACIAQYMKDNVVTALVTSNHRRWANASYIGRMEM